MGKLQVMIIGAGTGGLALTHGLRAAGIAVRAFERDHKLTDRLQGYRLTINARGAQALQLCLPKSNFARYIAASAKVSTAVSFFDHNDLQAPLSAYEQEMINYGFVAVRTSLAQTKRLHAR